MAGSVKVVLKSVFDDKGIKNAQKSLDTVSKGITNTFKGIGIATLAATAAIAKFSYDSINSASSLQESTNAVNVAFGNAAAGVLKIGESSAESLGLAKTEFNEAAVKFSAFATRVVGEGGDVAKFIGDVSTRAADFASVFNIEVAEAMQTFQSGLAGEAEPLKRFGINLLDSEVKAYAMANGIGEVGKELTETEKVQARYGLLMEATNKVQGDFSNTADSLANRQRILKASFEDVKAEVGVALLPAFEQIVGIVKDDMLPVLADLAEKVGPAVAETLEFVAGVLENAFTEGTDLNKALGTLGDTFDELFGIITGGTKDAEGFSDTVANLVYLVDWLVTTMTSLIAGFEGFGYAFDALKSGDLGEFWRFLTTDTIDYTNNIHDAEKATYNVADSMTIAAGETAKFNNIRLASIRDEMAKTRAEGERLAANQRQLYFAMKGLDPSKPLNASTTTSTSTTSSRASSGPSLADQQRKLIDKAKDQISSALKNYSKAVESAQNAYQKAIGNAEERYSKSITDATTRRDQSLANAVLAHAENISKIQSDFAKSQADIIQTSINRLRDAYKSAVQTNVADLFATDAVAGSVDALVTSLRDKLNASRRLLSNSAQLASQGFSQTFIEQVVGAGTETGNELANAILQATPETQAELQSLFGTIENEADTGMDALAKTMYEKTGLATSELKKLYEQTNTDLVAALAQAQTDYTAVQEEIQTTFAQAMIDATNTRKEAYADAQQNLQDALLDANKAFSERMAEIKKEFDEQIAEMGGAVRGLKSEIDALYKLMRNTPAISVSAPTISAPPAISKNLNTTKPASTNITVNVKTDATQSTAQVGKAIAKTINTYTKAGGGGGAAGVKYMVV